MSKEILLQKSKERTEQTQDLIRCLKAAIRYKYLESLILAQDERWRRA